MIQRDKIMCFGFGSVVIDSPNMVSVLKRKNNFKTVCAKRNQLN